MGQGFMAPDGKGEKGVMIVAEALGKDEVKAGVPLVGKAGLYTQRTFKKAGLDLRRDFWMANVVWCQPPENALAGMPWEKEATEHCGPNLDKAIRELKPKAILTFGDVALRRLTPLEGVMDCRGYPVWSEQFDCWIVPTLHPSFIMRGNHKYVPVFLDDVFKAIRIAEWGHEYEALMPLVDPNQEEWEKFVQRYLDKLKKDPSTALAFDIETPGKKGKDEDALDEGDPTYIILRCSFAFDSSDRDCVSIPWEPSYMAGVHRLLGSSGVKLVWNGPYDVPRLERAGVRFGGEIRDSMIAWHVSNSALPKKLGLVTTLCPTTRGIPMWKHLSAIDPGFYNAVDSLVLHRIDAWVQESLEKTGMMEVYRRQIADVDPIAKRMTDAGVLIDQTAKEELHQRALKIMEERLRKMDEAVPQEVKKKVIWKKERPQTKEILIEGKVKVCQGCQQKISNKGEHQKGKGNPCKGAQVLTQSGQVKAWEETLPFTPSTQQLLSYAKYMGYKIPTVPKTQKETMDSDAIEWLMKKYPQDMVFQHIGAYREAQKVDGTYVEGLPIWEDGRVHGLITHTPSTLRVAMRNPNLQNQPRPEDTDDPDNLYASIRNMFIAQDGWMLGARDFSGIEAVITGWFCQDPVYIRLAKLGIHSYLCSHLAGTPVDLKWSDEEIRAFYSKLKKKEKDLYFTSKKTVHLTNYGGTPRKMMEAEPEIFPDLKTARFFQEEYFKVAPKLRKWHYETCVRAEKLGYVKTPDGFMHRFHNLFRYEWDPHLKAWTHFNRRGEPMLGEDAKKALAEGPQHMAAVVMKAALVVLGRDERVAPYLRLTIHDELFWECPEEKMDEVDSIAAEVMERPCPYLEMPDEWGMGRYLSIGTEGKRGKRWGDMA